MEKHESAARGKVLLATVKGDVHDIGKNLVEIILANNGFEVINLGIKVPPAELISAIDKHRPDLIGLSGLLVKSAQQMVVTADDFARAGVTTPMLVGGAALSSNFVDNQISKAYTTGTVAYAADAMSGLDLAKSILDPARFAKLKAELEERRSRPKPAPLKRAILPASFAETRSPRISILAPAELPPAPDFERHVQKHAPIEQIWRFINPLMLYGRHLGIKGGAVRLLERAAAEPHDLALQRELAEKEPKALAVWRAVQEVKEEYRGTEVLRTSAIHRFYRVSSEGRRLHLFAGAPGDPASRARETGASAMEGLAEPPAWTFQFPRQRKESGLCLSDYARPTEPGHAAVDTAALFVVSIGKGVREMAENLKNRGDYLKSHIIQALALESAEAYAEMLHSQIRKLWGYPDRPEMTMLERFQAKYRGKRYSFGYPACPRLDDQAAIWSLLKPEDIGVQLTDGFMMDPESSVSALVFHHPDATYFSVGTGAAGDGDRESERDDEGNGDGTDGGAEGYDDNRQ